MGPGSSLLYIQLIIIGSQIKAPAIGSWWRRGLRDWRWFKWNPRLTCFSMKTTEQNMLYCINTRGWLLPRDNQAHTTRLLFSDEWWQDIFSEQILLVDVHCHYFHGFLINKMLLSDDWSLFYLETKYCNMSEDAERLINLYFIKSHLYLTFIRTEYIFNIKSGKLTFYCICDV